MLPFGVARHHTGEAALDAKPHITCRQLIDFIMSYQENDLPPSTRSVIERARMTIKAQHDEVSLLKRTLQ